MTDEKKKKSFKLEPRTDSLGVDVPTVIQVHEDGTQEEWCTVQDLDRLFNAAASRWGKNWDLEKVIVAIQETEIE